MRIILNGFFLGTLMLSTLTARAAIVDVVLDFTNPNWSGTLSFDNETGQAYTGDNLITAYSLTGFSVTSGANTWDLAEINQFFKDPPSYGALVDQNGRVAWNGIAADIDSGAVQLLAQLTSSPGAWLSTAMGGEEYTANVVPLPAAAWLFGSALLGLGVIGRKRA